MNGLLNIWDERWDSELYGWCSWDHGGELWSYLFRGLVKIQQKRKKQETKRFVRNFLPNKTLANGLTSAIIVLNQLKYKVKSPRQRSDEIMKFVFRKLVGMKKTQSLGNKKWCKKIVLGGKKGFDTGVCWYYSNKRKLL